MMKKILCKTANTAAALLSVCFISLLTVEAVLFFQGMRLDWLNTMLKHYPISKRENNETVYLDNSYAKRNGWTLYAGKHKSEEDPSVMMTVWQNHARASRPDPDKKAKINVAFINGSYTFGEGVRDQDTLAWKLNEKYPDVVFDNFAVPGYGPLQCGEHLKKYVFANKHYDLICYNINEGNLFVNSYPHAQHGSLEGNSIYIIAPYSVKDCFGRWHIYNSFKSEFIFSHRLLTVDRWQRLYFARKGSYDYTAHHKDPTNRIRDVYAHQVQELEKLCRSQNTDFAVCALEPKLARDIFPNLNIEGAKVDISFAGIEEPEYRVLQKRGFHPNAFVHAYWAEKFSKWFDKEYLPKKSKP